MKRVLKLVKAQVRRVYFRLARPLLNQVRAERAQEWAAVWEVVSAEAARLARAREEMERLNQGIVDYHEGLTQKVADELTKMNRKLESLARAA